MCGRINLRASPTELAEFFDLFRKPEWTPRYNLGPSQQILVVRQKIDGLRFAGTLQWGLVPAWAKDPSFGAQMNNARSDTVTSKPAFRNAIQYRRCLIPASGFYEWQHIDAKTKQPWNIFRSDGHPLAFAGLWEQFQLPDKTLLETCAVITTDANEFMREVHDRMPVILGKEDWNVWLAHHELEPHVLTSLLVPAQNDVLQKTPVSSFVNSVKNDSPECIHPIKAVRTLF